MTTFDSGTIAGTAEALVRSLRDAQPEALPEVSKARPRAKASTAAPRDEHGRGRVRTGVVRTSEDLARWMAKSASLHYVSDAAPGWSRRLLHGRYAYFDAKGHRVRDEKEVKRVDSLAIPPAYQHVWICPDPKGHIQATARDDRGRKQYRYHPRWIEISASVKFERMMAFGEMLPRIRRVVARALAQPGMGRDKVLAAVVQLLDLTLIRVGNDEYAKKNRSYGLTTLQTRHVRVKGNRISFGFRGKSGIEHEIELSHRALSIFMKACLEMPGREVFQYIDDNGKRRSVTSTDVNAYLQSLGDPSISAKDFRTWGASAMALGDLRERTFASATEGKRLSREMFKAVAERLGNTAAVCRKSYIHPHVVECFLDEKLVEIEVVSRRGLKPHEAAFLELLKTVGRVRRTSSKPAREGATLH